MKPPNSVFYRQRAEEAERLAAESHLVNVRHNLQDVARAWRVLEKSASQFEEAAAIRRLKTAAD